MPDGDTKTKMTSLDTIISAWKAERGDKVKTWRPDPKSSENFKQKVRNARKTVSDAESAVLAAKKAQDDAEAEAIRFFGPHSIQLDPKGPILSPTCRGERVFYREEDPTLPL